MAAAEGAPEIGEQAGVPAHNPAAAAADELAANVQQLDLNTTKALNGAMVYKGKTDDPPKEFFVKHWEVIFLAAGLDKSKWAITAAGKLAPEVLQLLLADNVTLTPETLATMSWDDFGKAFCALSTGPTTNTNLACHQALAKLRYDSSKPRNVATVLRDAEALFNKMTSKPDDSTKIYHVVAAVHPGLRSRVSYTPEGSDYPTYAAFRQTLLAQAAVFEAGQPSATPSAKPNTFGSYGSRNGYGNHNGKRYQGSGRSSGPYSRPPGSSGRPSGPSGPTHTFKRRGNGGNGRFQPYGKPSSDKTPLSEIICHNCGQKGHYANRCPNNKVCHALPLQNRFAPVAGIDAAEPELIAAADPSLDPSHMSTAEQSMWLLAKLARLRDTSIADMNADPGVEYAPESLADMNPEPVAASLLSTAAAPKGTSNPAAAGVAALSDEELIEAFVAEDQRKIAAGAAPSEPLQPPSGAPGRRKRRHSPAAPVEGLDVAVGCSPQPLSSAADADELQFSAELFQAVQGRLQKPCTIDACASKGGGNALLPRYFDPCNSFMSWDWGGSTDMLWLHPPRKGRESFLAKYANAKAHNPSLGAVILVPAKYTSPLLKSMPILDRFSRGSQIFTDVSTKQSVKAKCDFVLYIDAPKPLLSPPQPVDSGAQQAAAPSRQTTSHVMQLFGTVAGAPAQILLDSGAESYNYISAEFCQRIGLPLRPTRHPVTVKGVQDTQGVVAGACTAVVCMQTLKVEVAFVAIDLPEAFDVILGDAWLQQTKAKLDFENHTATVQKGRRTHTLLMQQGNATPQDSATAALAPVLSYASAKRCMKQSGVWHCLVLVKPTGGETSNTQAAQPADEAPPEADQQAQQLKAEYPTVFTDHPPHGGSKIQLGFEVIPVPAGTNPVLRRMYRYSPMEMEEMEKQIKLLLELGYIRPSQSPYGAPVLFVKKPRSTELRMVIDYRALNKLTKRNAFPLPRIDDMLDHLAGAKVFSLIDLRQAYHQCRLVESDVPKTAFRTPLGHYEYLTLSFGLTNAPAAFQSVMNRLFSKHMYKFVMIYLDDILVFSKDAEEHSRHLRVVLDILREANLTVALHKCKFYQEEVLFLGHIVSGSGVKVDPAKVRAVNDFPRPADVHHLRSFLGMATYFRRFIDKFARVVHPLTNLLRKDQPWSWTEDCEAAFCKIKQLLTTAPVLALPDWRSTKPFELVCDASIQGVGGVLLQDGRPIAFESRKLTPAEVRYATPEQEMLAVHYCVEKWRCYIEGRDVHVYTDHKPNTFFDTVNMQSRRASRWLEKLQQHQLQWHYKPGPQNVVADALSRHPVVDRPVMLLAVLRSASVQRKLADSNSFVSAIKQAYASDPYFSARENTVDLVKKSDLWYMGDLLVLPNDEQLKLTVMAECHDTPYAGHVGRTKTLHNVCKNFWWPGLARDVRRFVATCDSCQRVKSSNKAPVGLLQPLPVPGDTWDSVSMDLIVSLPQTADGFTAVAVFVDRLSKMVHLAPCRDDTTAEQFAELFVQHVFKLHGLPSQFVSDRDPRFVGKVWKSLVQRLGITHAMSTAYHPETDGNTERVNRVLEDMLRHFVDPAQSN